MKPKNALVEKDAQIAALESQLSEARDELAIKNAQLETLAYTDMLTTLGNRFFFYQTVEPFLAAALQAGKKYALLYIDLCNFKQINDCYGHNVGDEVLIAVAKRIRGVVPHHDVVARLSGDEFVVLTECNAEVVHSYAVAKKIIAAIKEIIFVAGHQLHIQARMGVSTFPEISRIETLLRCAEMALSESKETSPKISFYTKKLEAKHHQRMMIESYLANAFKQQEFYVVYQPIFSVATGAVSGIEALLRWDSHSLRDISPEEFFSIVDDLEINQRLCEFVTRCAGQAFQYMAARGLHLTTVSINVTARQFLWEDFASYFLACLEEIQLSPQLVMLEITERQAINHFHACKTQLSRLKAQGIRVALDDYGTGFSSITHLKQLPIDTIKLDQSLISHSDQEAQRNKELSAGVVKMAHHLNLQVVAEGVETEEEYESLKEIGCDYLQGYYLGRPMVIEDLVRYLQQAPTSNTVAVLRPVSVRKV